MDRRRLVRVLVLIFPIACSLSGCGPMRVAGPVECAEVGEWSGRDWQGIVDRYVVDGEVNFEALKPKSADLEAFVRRLGCFGPTRTPERFSDAASQLAYWINGHNAVALLAAVKRYPCKGIKPALGDFAENVSAWIDGRTMTLAQMAEQALAAAGGDPRVTLALVYPAKGSGKMFHAAFTPEEIERQLGELVKRALDDPAMVKIDHEAWALRLGGPIYRHRQSYLERYRKLTGTDGGTIVNALAMDADARQRRQLNTALAYPVKEIPYDWTLNEYTRPKCSLD